MKQKITIATRKSELALVQARRVKQLLLEHYPHLDVEFLEMTTEGDRKLDSSLAKIGGKGLFIKELETALLDGRADIAVHSMKDVPMVLPDGLMMACVLDRIDARDVFVSNHYQGLSSLPAGACIGTSSARRKSQLLLHYPELQVKDVRGNVQTRLKKLDEGQFDAVILAAAGLLRLNMESRIQDYIPVTTLLPSPGQAALGIECRAEDEEVIAMLKPLHDELTQCCVSAERVISTMLQASCQLPLAAHAFVDGDEFEIKALIAMPDGSRKVTSKQSGSIEQAQALAEQAAEDLLQQGGQEILAACR